MKLSMPARVVDVARRHVAADVAEKSDLPLVVSCAVGVSLVVGATAFLVWVRTAQVEAGYAIQKLRGDQVRLANEASALDVELASLLRPDRLASVATKDLGMEAPDARRTFHLQTLARTAMSGESAR